MKKSKDEKELREIEDHLENLYFQDLDGYTNEEHMVLIFDLEKWKRVLLEEKKASWRLKSRALWLEKGGENTKFFHQYENHRKNVNTISKMQGSYGNMINNFKDSTSARATHFNGILKEYVEPLLLRWLKKKLFP